MFAIKKTKKLNRLEVLRQKRLDIHNLLLKAFGMSWEMDRKEYANEHDYERDLIALENEVEVMGYMVKQLNSVANVIPLKKKG